jgi:hypothetical protein
MLICTLESSGMDTIVYMLICTLVSGCMDSCIYVNMYIGVWWFGQLYLC